MTKTVQTKRIFPQKANLERISDYGKCCYYFLKDKLRCDLSCFLCFAYYDSIRTLGLEVL